MPITLEKLFSPTVDTSFDFLGETVHVTWAPFRYTGEMQAFAEKLGDDERAEQLAIAELRADGHEEEASAREVALDYSDKRALRQMLSVLLVGWDVMDGKKQVKTDLATLNTLPDVFLRVVFLSLAQANQPDPPKAPNSEGA